VKIRHTHISRSAAVLVLAAGVLIVAGHFFGVQKWTTLGTNALPVNLPAAIAFVLSAIALWLSVVPHPPHRLLRIFGLSLTVASGVAAWIAITVGTASTDPALAVAFACIGSCTYVLNRKPESIRNWMCLPLIPVFWATYFSLTAAFYQTKNLNPYFERTLIPLPAALVFAAFLIGQLAVRPDRGLIATVLSRNSGGLLARVTLPILLLLPFTIGWVRIRAVRSGTYDLAASFAQFSTTNVVVFGAVLWWCAYVLNRMDARRQTILESLRDANQELHRVNAALEAKIAEQVRTEAARKRTELQLFQSQKMEAMGTLASGIAHDFNNLLTVILLNAEAALDDVPKDPAVDSALREIKKSGTRAAEVVRQIMTFGRKNPAGRRPENVGDMVTEAVAMLRHALQTGIEVRIDLAPDLPQILADATQVQQVLLNLGNNALQALPATGGILEIGAVAVTCESNVPTVAGLRPGRYVRITVRDNGHGMSMDTLERVFDPFFTTKPPGKGTGLGLAVVHGIMQLHEGTVTVRSEVGKGSTFSLYFPVVKEAD
jgi:signal transduction histidine kinase